MELLAALLQPVRAFQLHRLLAKAAGFGSAVDAEIAVGLDFVFESAADDLDHDGIVQKTQAGDVIGNQVLRLGKIGKRLQHVVAVFAFHAPTGIDDHANQCFELAHPLADEIRGFGLRDLRQQLAGVVDDGGFVQVTRFLKRLKHDPLKVFEIVIAQFKGNFHGHGALLRVCLRGAVPRPGSRPSGKIQACRVPGTSGPSARSAECHPPACGRFPSG